MESVQQSIKSIVTNSVEPFLIFVSTIFFVLITPWPLTSISYTILIIGIGIVPINAYFASKNRNIKILHSRDDIFDFVRWSLNFSIDFLIVWLANVTVHSFLILWIALSCGALVDITEKKLKITISIYIFVTFIIYIYTKLPPSRDGLYIILVFVFFLRFLFQISTNWHEILKRNYEVNVNLSDNLKEKKKELEISYRKSMENEKMATVGLLSAGVAHQLGNTLNSISSANMNLARFIEKNAITKEKIERSVNIINRSIEVSEQIIRGLDISTKKNIKAETFSLHSVVETSIILTKGKTLESIKILNNIDKGIQAIAKKNSILQVFINLILNASDAMKGQNNAVVEFGGKLMDRFVIVTVSDNGPGIPTSIIDKIFLPFETSKDSMSGSGLGLYVVSEEIKDNNGKIEVHSSDQGTTFSIHLLKAEE